MLSTTGPLLAPTMAYSMPPVAPTSMSDSEEELSDGEEYGTRHVSHMVHMDNAAASAVADDAPSGSDGEFSGDDGANDSSNGDGDKKDDDETSDRTPGKKRKTAAATAKADLDNFDPRVVGPKLSARLVYIGFDIEVTGSDRQESGIVELGAQIMVESDDGKSSAPSSAPADHFNLRCTPHKGCVWSKNSIECHNITYAVLSAEKAPCHKAALEKTYAWMVERAQAHRSDPIIALVVHNGSSCDLDWLWHYQRR